MTFAEKMHGIIDKGMAASRDLASRAGEKAKDLGAMGVLKLEILQLQTRAEKFVARLGTEVYATLVDRNQATVSRDTPLVRGMLDEIEALRARIEAKEKEYRAIGGKEDL
jgi:hypothetical protein